MKKLLLYVTLCIITAYPQGVFYQQDNKLTVAEHPFKIHYNNSDYCLYKGIISADGNYFAGILIDSVIDAYINSYSDSGGIVDFPSEKLQGTFVIFSKMLSKVTFSMDIWPPDPYFFCENFLIMDNWRGVFKVINSSTGVIEFDNKDKEPLHPVNINNYLFCFSWDSPSTYIYSFSGRSLTPHDLGDKSKGELLSYDSSGTAVYTVKDSLPQIIVFNKGVVEKKYTFHETMKTINNSDEFFVIGTLYNTEPECLYQYDRISRTLIKCFEMNNYRSLFPEYYINIETVCRQGSSLYLLPHQIDKMKSNLILFNMDNSTFRFITGSGRINPPIGTFYEIKK